MKILLIELFFQLQLGFGSQHQQLFIAIIVGSGLCWRPERVAINFSLGIQIIFTHIFHQYPFGFFRRNQTQVQHRIQPYSRRSQQARLQGIQLSIQRHVLFRNRFGIQSPTFDIGRIEREQSPRSRYATAQHGGEL